MSKSINRAPNHFARPDDERPTFTSDFLFCNILFVKPFELLGQTFFRTVRS